MYNNVGAECVFSWDLLYAQSNNEEHAETTLDHSVYGTYVPSTIRADGAQLVDNDEGEAITLILIRGHQTTPPLIHLISHYTDVRMQKEGEMKSFIVEKSTRRHDDDKQFQQLKDDCLLKRLCSQLFEGSKQNVVKQIVIMKKSL